MLVDLQLSTLVFHASIHGSQRLLKQHSQGRLSCCTTNRCRKEHVLCHPASLQEENCHSDHTNNQSHDGPSLEAAEEGDSSHIPWFSADT